MRKIRTNIRLETPIYKNYPMRRSTGNELAINGNLTYLRGNVEKHY